MTPWKRTVQSALGRGEALSGGLRARLGRITGGRGPVLILPYRGIATPRRVSVGGRVLRDPGFQPANEQDAWWRNLVAFYRRMQSDEVPQARIGYRFHGLEGETRCDHEGYFQVELVPLKAPAGGRWHKVALALHAPQCGPEPVTAEAQVLAPSIHAKLGIISDIDDTILQSGVRNKLRMVLRLALSNARTRKPFSGVGAFYRALHRGANGRQRNPVFYVSSSPWNLYAPLVEFLDIQGLPAGPLLLRDFGAHSLFHAGNHGSHKLAGIESILSACPLLPFLLIGDSGEQDPEIYADVVRRHPGRIHAIYIRCVDPDAQRRADILRLAEEVRHNHGNATALVLAADSDTAAAHAATEGLISLDDWERVRQDRQRDDQAPWPAQMTRGRVD